MEINKQSLVSFLFQPGAAGGMSSSVTSMSRSGKESMGGAYAGANDMVNNGLSANQNQVSLSDIDVRLVDENINLLTYSHHTCSNSLFHTEDTPPPPLL